MTSLAASLLVASLALFQPGATGEDTKPHFSSNSPRNVTAQLERHAYLPCMIRHLDKKVVAWLRAKDDHILSVGDSAFTKDERIQVFKDDGTSPDEVVITLMIKFARHEDSGLYECQIITEPKQSWLVDLRVVEPSVEIIRAPDIYAKTESPVRIQCKITHSEPDDVIFWFHNGKRILTDSREGGRDRSTQREVLSPQVMLETLTIENAHKSDAGNYTCFLSDRHYTSVELHIINGKHPQAIQDNRTNGTLKGGHHLVFYFALLSILKIVLVPL